VCVESYVPALEQMQMAFAVQLDNALEILLATARLALCPFAEIAIGRLPVTSSSRHV
jgi:hypothetical protein